MSQRIGQQLGTYRLLRVLGEGGFATVYLGEHVHLGTLAALKLLHLSFSPEVILPRFGGGGKGGIDSSKGE